MMTSNGIRPEFKQFWSHCVLLNANRKKTSSKINVLLISLMSFTLISPEFLLYIAYII